MTKNFNKKEFVCKCGCGYDDVKIEDVKKLQKLRDIVGFPLVLNSCCRCKKHNKEINGTKHSEHLDCKGFDIACSDSVRRFKIVTNANKCGFNRVGVYKSFIHLGVSKKHPQNVLWHG